MLAKFIKLSEAAYDFEKALDCAKINQNDINQFKEKVDELENVPKSLLDKQASA